MRLFTTAIILAGVFGAVQAQSCSEQENFKACQAQHGATQLKACKGDNSCRCAVMTDLINVCYFGICWTDPGMLQWMERRRKECGLPDGVYEKKGKDKEEDEPKEQPPVNTPLTDDQRDEFEDIFEKIGDDIEKVKEEKAGKSMDDDEYRAALEKLMLPEVSITTKDPDPRDKKYVERARKLIDGWVAKRRERHEREKEMAEEEAKLHPMTHIVNPSSTPPPKRNALPPHHDHHLLHGPQYADPDLDLRPSPTETNRLPDEIMYSVTHRDSPTLATEIIQTHKTFPIPTVPGFSKPPFHCAMCGTYSTHPPRWTPSINYGPSTATDHMFTIAGAYLPPGWSATPRTISWECAMCSPLATEGVGSKLEAQTVVTVASHWNWGYEGRTWGTATGSWKEGTGTVLSGTRRLEPTGLAVTSSKKVEARATGEASMLVGAAMTLVGVVEDGHYTGETWGTATGAGMTRTKWGKGSERTRTQTKEARGTGSTWTG